MQNSFKAVSATSGSNQPEPLAPVTLLRAGVPAREVVWFRRLTPAKRMAALRTTRGQLLLDTVRAFVAKSNGSTQAMPA